MSPLAQAGGRLAKALEPDGTRVIQIVLLRSLARLRNHVLAHTFLDELLHNLAGAEAPSRSTQQLIGDALLRQPSPRL